MKISFNQRKYHSHFVSIKLCCQYSPGYILHFRKKYFVHVNSVRQYSNESFVYQYYSKFWNNYMYNYFKCPTLRYEPRHEKTCLRGLQPGKTQTGMLSYRDKLES